jgi:hypothetical protein
MEFSNLAGRHYRQEIPSKTNANDSATVNQPVIGLPELLSSE